MKAPLRFPVLAAALMSLGLASTARRAEPSLEPRGDHPYLLFTAADVARLKDRISRDPIIADSWTNLPGEPFGELLVIIARFVCMLSQWFSPTVSIRCSYGHHQ